MTVDVPSDLFVWPVRFWLTELGTATEWLLRPVSVAATFSFENKNNRKKYSITRNWNSYKTWFKLRLICRFHCCHSIWSRCTTWWRWTSTPIGHWTNRCCLQKFCFSCYWWSIIIEWVRWVNCCCFRYRWWRSTTRSKSGSFSLYLSSKWKMLSTSMPSSTSCKMTILKPHTFILLISVSTVFRQLTCIAKFSNSLGTTWFACSKFLTRFGANSLSAGVISV